MEYAAPAGQIRSFESDGMMITAAGKDFQGGGFNLFHCKNQQSPLRLIEITEPLEYSAQIPLF
jgi:hypothetical protein